MSLGLPLRLRIVSRTRTPDSWVSAGDGDACCPLGNQTGRPSRPRYLRAVCRVGCDWHTINGTVVAYGRRLTEINPHCVGDLTIHKSQERFVSPMLGNFREAPAPPS